MDNHRNKTTERILNLTLEIIYLLTEEHYTGEKKTSCECVMPSSHTHMSRRWRRIQCPITKPLLNSHIHVRNQKILELTNKITELLTGEVPIRCQDVSVYFSMEEWEYLEGHKDLYKDIMMEDHLPVTSPDGSSKRNPPERCPSPLYSLNCPEENAPQDHQSEDLTPSKDGTKEEGAIDNTGDGQLKNKEIKTYISPSGSRKRNTPQKCPSPLYSKDCPEEDLAVPHDHQIENLIHIKVEVTDEDVEMDINRTTQYKEEEKNANIGSGLMATVNTTEGLLISSPDCKTAVNNILQYYPAQDYIDINAPPTLHSKDLFFDFLNDEEHSLDESYLKDDRGDQLYSCFEGGNVFRKQDDLIQHQRGHMEEKPFSCMEFGNLFTQHDLDSGKKSFQCSDCGKLCTSKSGLMKHQRVHTREKPFSCAECGKCFTQMCSLVVHKRIHTGEKPFSCTECGKCFMTKANLRDHQRIHTGEKPFSCSQCGKCFTQMSSLAVHQRFHLEEKPCSCSECGKSFKSKSNLRAHQRIHTGEKPFSCTECGKCFTHISNLAVHQKIHRKEKPYSCSECGKSFIIKSNLRGHQRIHTGEKPFSCSDCGKCFITKSELGDHHRIHTGERPFLCSQCGKCFKTNSHLRGHQKTHTGEKPFPCSECGKCFTTKANLKTHQRLHTSQKLFSSNLAQPESIHVGQN